MRSIYFDYNATTPLDSAVREAMMPFLGEVWGNPSSVHHIGRKARASLDEFRERSAKVLGCRPSEVIFTSGGTESANLAIFGAARVLRSKGRHIITSAIEHHAVLHTVQYLAKHEGFEITILPVDREGLISPDNLRKALRPDTVLVSLMAVNNEIGTIQPVTELGSICRERGVLFHSDAVQWFGKEPFAGIQQFNADFVSICAHKFHGPKGAGALFIKSPLHPDPILFGGSHENERRAGTENLPAIAGFVEALERFVTKPVFSKEKLEPLASRLLQLIESVPGVHFVGSREHRLANTVSFLVEDADSISLLANLDLEGICASSGSACSAGSIEPSHVISALGFDRKLANSLVRFSLGRDSSVEEIKYTEKVLPEVIHRAQRTEKAGKRL
jgi:cysteine desulfurase